MLHVKINSSRLSPDFHWEIDAQFEEGHIHHVLALNGVGKTTFFEELKLQWKDLFQPLELAFCDQAPLTLWQNLTVEQVMDILWDATPTRHLEPEWRELELWKRNAPLQRRFVGELSGGENQWLKLLMLQSIQSDVWLLDEPFQSLDTSRLQDFSKLLVQANQTIILAHHGEFQHPRCVRWLLERQTKSVTLKRCL